MAINLINRISRGVNAGRRRAVFLDKDGTLVEDVPYNADPGKLRFTPQALEGLKLLAAFDYALVLVSNQPGIALGRFDLSALQRIERAISDALAPAGVHLDGFYICPHAPVPDDAMQMACGCRKPAPGLLFAAAQALSLDLARSWMVGDILDDIEAGRRAGCRTVLLEVGNETVWRQGPLRVPHARAPNVFEAAHRIVALDLAQGASRSTQAAGRLSAGT